MKPMDDEKLIPLCKKLAGRFVRQASHLGSREDVFDELVNVAYVAGKEGKYIIWALIAYTTKPSSVRKRRAFRTGDERKIRKRRKEQLTPLEALEEKDEELRLSALLFQLNPLDLSLIQAYFAQGKTYPEVGKIFGKSDRWASGRIKNILAKLRERMER